MNKKQVQQFLKQNNLQPIKKFGQNFLINQGIIQKIVETALKHSPPFVEIGPGLGALTRHFENKKKETLLLIERDKKLAAYWKSTGYTVICADALKLKWETLPKKITVFGNLPYEITASLILKSCFYQHQIQHMIFMMQKEVAQRITAQPHNKNYGLLSVISQTFWDTKLVANVQKTDFYPIPKVKGRVLEFQIRNQMPNLHIDLFIKFVKQCFSFKRKMLFKQMDGLPSESARKALKSLNFSETCRAEELSPHQFLELYFTVKKESKS